MTLEDNTQVQANMMEEHIKPTRYQQMTTYPQAINDCLL